MSVSHGGEVDEDAWVAGHEVDVLREEHRGVAVGIECKMIVVESACAGKEGGFAGEPTEDGKEGVVIAEQHAFGMPLNADDGFALGALDCFDDAVRGNGTDTESRGWLMHGLVMEGVDGEGG